MRLKLNVSSATDFDYTGGSDMFENSILQGKDSGQRTGREPMPLNYIDGVCMPWNNYDIELIALYPPTVCRPGPFHQVLSRLTKEVKADGF
eukprot:gene27209-2455_t